MGLAINFHKFTEQQNNQTPMFKKKINSITDVWPWDEHQCEASLQYRVSVMPSVNVGMPFFMIDSNDPKLKFPSTY